MTLALLLALSLQAQKLNDLETAIKGGETFKKIGSVVVSQRGKIVYEKYFEGDASTLRDTRSATKSITSALIGFAIQDKKLTLDTRILDLLPQHAKRIQNPDPRKSKITIEDFLTMSSPLECDDWNDASRGNEERMYLIEDWAQFILDLPIRGRMRIGEKPEPPPFGRHFSYCTGGVFTLSEAIEAATKTRTDHYAQQKLFGPLGIDKAEWTYSPLDIPQTGGGLRLSSTSLLKIGQLYLKNGGGLLNEAWIKASTTPHAQIDSNTNYGYLWWLKTWTSKAGKQYPSFYMTGNGGNKVVVMPSLDAVVVITSTNYNTRGMHEQTDKILTDYVLPALEEAERH